MICPPSLETADRIFSYTSKTSASLLYQYHSASSPVFESDSYVNRIHRIDMHKFRPRATNLRPKEQKTPLFGGRHILTICGNVIPLGINWIFMKIWTKFSITGRRFLKMILETLNYKQLLTFFFICYRFLVHRSIETQLSYQKNGIRTLYFILKKFSKPQLSRKSIFKHLFCSYG